MCMCEQVGGSASASPNSGGSRSFRTKSCCHFCKYLPHFFMYINMNTQKKMCKKCVGERVGGVQVHLPNQGGGGDLEQSCRRNFRNWQHRQTSVFIFCIRCWGYIAFRITCIYTYIYVLVYIYIYIYAYVYLFICVYVCGVKCNKTPAAETKKFPHIYIYIYIYI